MARDILREYGPNSRQPQAGGVSCGGVLPGDQRDVMNYQPPVGPKGIMDPKGPGLHGHNCGNHNQPYGTRTGGSVGIQSGGGRNHGNRGSQSGSSY